jgi:hypothetical protein
MFACDARLNEFLIDELSIPSECGLGAGALRRAPMALYLLRLLRSLKKLNKRPEMVFIFTYVCLTSAVPCRT